MPGAHAKLSASAAERWLACPGSVALEDGIKEKPSEYAAEGTLAHAICELKLRKKFQALKPSTYKAELAKLQADPLYAHEMDGHTDEYAAYVTERAMAYRGTPFVSIETRVCYDQYAPEGFGTADCIIIGTREDTGLLEMDVIDFKYGQGVPKFAAENPQMRLYALGAAQTFSMVFAGIQSVTTHIFQPRIDCYSEYTETLEELRRWGAEVVRPTAEKALSGNGELHSGAWCQFCKAKGNCRARVENNTAFDDFRDVVNGGMKKPPTLTDAEVGEVLIRAQSFEAWLKDLRDYAEGQLLDGREVPGWKLVEGRSVRSFTDQDAAYQALKDCGIADAALYTRKPIPLGEAEKLIGKKDFAKICGPYIVKPPGKPTLAPESDKREAMMRGAAADFAGLENKGDK